MHGVASPFPRSSHNGDGSFPGTPRGTGATHPANALAPAHFLVSAPRTYWGLNPISSCECEVFGREGGADLRAHLSADSDIRWAVSETVPGTPDGAQNGVSVTLRSRSRRRKLRGSTRVRHSPVRILSAQPLSRVILARRETLRKSPDIPCVSPYDSVSGAY